VAELIATPRIGLCRAARSWRRRQREDVLLPGDPAIRQAVQAVQAAYAGPSSTSQQELLAIAEEWRPYHSLATRYLDSAAFVPAEVPLVARLRSA
jgi:3-methyladenine DNA glycosylase/8-oxoguanine DNA glycosylase